MDLKLARMKKGLSQKEFASIIGVHPALVSQYEHKHRRPSIETAKKIASVLEIHWADLFEDYDDKHEQIDKQVAGS